MKLKLQRMYRADNYTIGKLYIDGVYFCDTLEDTDRKLNSSMSLNDIAKIKIKTRTAIPTGSYELNIDTTSSHFISRGWAKPYKGKIPRLLGVPGFDGVLVHPTGNSAADTEGCILVGKNKIKGGLTESVNTFNKLMNDKLLPNKDKKIVIEIL